MTFATGFLRAAQRGKSNAPRVFALGIGMCNVLNPAELAQWLKLMEDIISEEKRKQQLIQPETAQYHLNRYGRRPKIENNESQEKEK
jgi:hypothetical protein